MKKSVNLFWNDMNDRFIRSVILMLLMIVLGLVAFFSSWF